MIIFNSWHCLHNIFLILKNVTGQSQNNLFLLLSTLRQNLLNLKWKMTPWSHIFIDHIFIFESFKIRPVFLTCHAIEGHHRQVKRDFGHSIHSTKRRYGRSGLIDIMDVDNVILSLMGLKIFPWRKLYVQLGPNLPPLPRGILYKNILKQFPILLPPILESSNINIENFDDLCSNDGEILNNNIDDYEGDDDIDI